MRAQALRARARRRGLPKNHGERYPGSMPSNILDRQFATTVRGHPAKPEMGGRFHRRLDGRGLALCRGGDRPVLAPCHRLVDEQQHDRAVGGRRAGHGDLAARQPQSMLHRSDRGSPYSSEQFQRLMAGLEVTYSMSRSGNVWDNAAMESFFSSLKTERIRGRIDRSRDQARADVFDYIECFYSPRRRHSTIGYLSPTDFETLAEAG